jgi:external thioesterase TEII
MKKTQLFLLHFAGGNRYSFNQMLPFLKAFDVVPLELPGRGKRMKEALLKDFNRAAEDMYLQLTAKLTASSFMIYGHSMGAYLTLRLTNMLEQAGKFPVCIIVSGNAGPGLKDTKRKDLHLLERKSFIKELQQLGGVPPELIEHEELFDFFEPVLRADFEIAELHGLENEPAVKAPLCAIMGNQEENVGHIVNWSRFTKSKFNSEILEGNHFFINRQPQAMVGIISSCYSRAITSLSQNTLFENPIKTNLYTRLGGNINICL